MNIIRTFFLAGALLFPGSAAFADMVSQTMGPGGTVSTTVQTPASTTTIKTNPGHSVVMGATDGNTYELDSDGSAYTVFPDGARVSATDGQHTLANGQIITVKNGKRIP